jgi:hypothetical protein
MNAAAATLLAPAAAEGPARQPLSLLASKSVHGHGEPAAGLIALLHAAAAAAAAARHPVLHLRALNPLVAGVLEGVRPGHQTAGPVRGVAVGRQPAPLPLARAKAGEAAALAFAGTSSFAFMVGWWLARWRVCGCG